MIEIHHLDLISPSYTLRKNCSTRWKLASRQWIEHTRKGGDSWVISRINLERNKQETKQGRKESKINALVVLCLKKESHKRNNLIFYVFFKTFWQMSSNGNVLNEGWDSFYLQHHVKLSNWPMSEAASTENPEVTGMYRKIINKCCLVILLFSTQEQPLCKWLFQLFSTIQFLFKVHTVPLMQTHCPRMQSNVDNKCYHRIKQQKGSTKWKKAFIID